MSKIGQKSIEIPQGVTLTIEKKTISIKGPKGEYTVTLPKSLEAVSENGSILIKRSDDEKKTKSLHGLYRQLVFNGVSGVTAVWQKRLEVVGTGFSVKLKGEDLEFKLGFSHPVVFKKVTGVSYQVEGNTKVIVSGVDRQLVGQVTSQIKLLKEPDAYKGKGIRYEGEKLRLKPGKKAKALGAPGAPAGAT